MMGDNLADYPTVAKQCLDSLEKAKERVEDHLFYASILWPSYRTGSPGPLDARAEYFMLLAVIVQNLRLTFMSLHDQLCDRGWWISHSSQFFGPQVNDKAYIDAVEGYMTMARQYASGQMESITEHTLSSIATSHCGPFALSATTGFANAFEYVLSKVALLEKYRVLLDILRLVRNANHSNGIFSDRAGDTIKTYDGVTYEFRLNYPVKWDNDDMVLMIEWMADAMWEVLKSPPVLEIPHAPVL